MLKNWRDCAYLKLLLAALLATSLQAAKPMTANPSPLQWIKIITPTDPNFHGKIKSIFGQTADSPLVTAALPYSIVLTHTGYRNLQGVCVRWTITTAGKSVPHEMFYQHLTDPRNVFLHPGESAFFSPVRSINFLSKSTKAQSMAGERATPNDADSIMLSKFTSADSVSVSVDLIVADDGTSAGPDAGQHIKVENQQREAYEYMRDACLSRLAQKQSVVDYLTPFAQMHGSIDPATGFPDRYKSMQIHTAQRWLGVLSNPALQGTFTDALASQTPEALFPITLKGGLK